METQLREPKTTFNKSHPRENNPISQINYETNLEKFNRNNRIIFEQLLTGKKLTGIDIAKLGILEYRKRFDDLKKVYGIPVQDDYVEGQRYKEWWLEQSFINEYLS